MESRSMRHEINKQLQSLKKQLQSLKFSIRFINT